jgi:hypothetical protein
MLIHLWVGTLQDIVKEELIRSHLVDKPQGKLMRLFIMMLLNSSQDGKLLIWVCFSFPMNLRISLAPLLIWTLA